MKVKIPFIICLFLTVLNSYPNAVVDSLEARLPSTKGEEKFNLLMELARYCSRSDIEKSLDYAQKAYDLARVEEKTEWKANALNGLAIIRYNMGNNYSAMHYFEEFITLIEEQLENEPGSEKLLQRLITGYNNIGNVYKDLGEYNQAMHAMMAALKLMDSLPHDQRNESLYIKINNNLGTVYIELKEFGKARKILGKALAMSRGSRRNLEVSITLNNLGLVNIETQNYDSALACYRQAIEIAKKINDSIALGGYYNNIGLIYEKEKKWTKALDNYNTSLSISRNLGYKLGIANTLGNIAKIRIEIRKYPEAEADLKRALAIARSAGIRDLVRKIYSYFYELYDRQNRYMEALEYHLLYTALSDSMFNEKKSKQIAEMEAKYETEKKEKENELLKKDIEIRKTNQNLSLVAISGLGVLSVLLFMLFRARSRSLLREKTIRKLEMDKKGIETKRLEDQVFAEQQINRLQKEKLEQRNRELSANIIHIMNKNMTLRSILDEMEIMKDMPGEDRKQCFRKISGLIQSNLNLDNDWEQFKLHFIMVHPSFFSKLNERFPNLTPNEHRLSAYLKINLNTKEIAQMLNVSPDAVVKSRYRLRKKLELPSEADLAEFMNKI